MKNKIIISTALILGLTAGSSAFAQNYDHRDHDRHDDHGERHNDRGEFHHFHRGERLSGDYRDRQYVVDNWREHRLSAPPRGYHWVQTGPDYVLAAVATGIIAQIVLGH
jgi:Ni/Co efflux regulator RcnB